MTGKENRSGEIETSDDANIREVYKELNNNMRSFIILRFRHFATFAVIMAFVATAAFRTERLESFTIPILGFGVLVTVLFWALDHRTGQYLRYFASSARAVEQEFLREAARFDGLVSNPPEPKIMSASAITNLIFAVILLGWIGFTVIFETSTETTETEVRVHNSLPPQQQSLRASQIRALQLRTQSQRGP